MLLSCLSRLQQQVHMIRHERVRDDFDLHPLPEAQ